MFKAGQYSFSKMAIIAITGISLVLAYFFRWHGNGGNSVHFVINADGKDYYQYLVSVFIDKNLTHLHITDGFVVQTPTGNINEHTVGVSLLLLPFFLIGYTWALLSHATLDGYSAPFQIMVSIAALFYLAVGLIYLRRLLLAFTDKDKTIALVIILIFFGTNLLNYSVNEPSMSHLYSFALISAFLFYVDKLFRQPLPKCFYLSSLMLGLIILVRPVNAIIVLVAPFFAGSFDNFITRIKYFFRQKKILIFSACLFLAAISVQSFIWYLQNGRLVQWSYKHAGFYFGHPQTWLMLFGFDSGFFIYTPLGLLILLGFVPLFPRNKFQFFILLFFMMFSFYFFSCYYAYTYYDGLGIRTLVDFYALFALLLTLLLIYIADKKIRYPVLVLITGGALLNLVFCYQYEAGILPATGMNFKKFKYIFLKADKSYANVLGGSYDLPPYSSEPPKPIYTYTHNDTLSFNHIEYGLSTSIPLNFKSDELYIKINLKRKEYSPNSSSDVLIAIQITSEKGMAKDFQFHKLNDVPSETCCKWEDVHSLITMASPALSPGDKLSIYIWNRDKQNFSISNYSVEVYNYTY